MTVLLRWRHCSPWPLPKASGNALATLCIPHCWVVSSALCPQELRLHKSLAAFSPSSSEGEAGHAGQPTVVLFKLCFTSTLHPPVAIQIQCFPLTSSAACSPWGNKVRLSGSSRNETPREALTLTLSSSSSRPYSPCPVPCTITTLVIDPCIYLHCGKS